MRRLWQILVAILVFVPLPALALLFSVGAPPIAPPSGLGAEDFVGPLASWVCAQSQASGHCGAAATSCSTTATGDGVTDDTAALQSCLTSISGTPGTPNCTPPSWFSHPVIYIPAGSYKVTAALTVSCTNYVSVIGHSPADTHILWRGTTSGNILNLSGVAFSRFDRIDFNGSNGANTAAMGIEDPAAASPNCCFDTGNEYVDDIFENFAKFGFACGLGANGCSELSFIRDQFSNITCTPVSSCNAAAIDESNNNACDVWVWGTLFHNNTYGVTNWLPTINTGCGYTVYDSNFESSGNTDFGIGIGPAIYNIVGNYSNGSAQFLRAGSLSIANPISMIGNTVVSSGVGTTAPIALGTFGATMLLNNNFQTGQNAGTLTVDSTGAGDLFSMGNIYKQGSLTTPCGSGAPIAALRCHEIATGTQPDTIATNTPTEPTLPSTPAISAATIQEVACAPSTFPTCTTTTATIQSAINTASGGGVVHIQPGQYSITATLTIPSGANIEIIGDGQFTELDWNGSGAGPILSCGGVGTVCQGVVVRDLALNGKTTGDGLVVNNNDQPQGRVWIEQPNFGAVSTDDITMTATGLVEIHDAQFQNNSSSTADFNASSGTIDIFNAVTAADLLGYAVTGTGRIFLNAVWQDHGPATSVIATLAGSGLFAMNAMHFAINNATTSSLKQINATSFTGIAALTVSDMAGGCNAGNTCYSNIAFTGTGTGGQILALGIAGQGVACPNTAYFSDTATGDTNAFINSFADNATATAASDTGANYCRLAESTFPSTSFLVSTAGLVGTMLPSLPGSPAFLTGTTDARLYRVAFLNCVHAMQVN